MSAVTEAAPQQSALDGDRDVSHYVCNVCWPQIEDAIVAECGARLSVTDHVCPDDGSCGCIDCPLCELACDLPCSLCGAR